MQAEAASIPLRRFWSKISIVVAILLMLLDIGRLVLLSHAHREAFTDGFETVVVLLSAVACGFAAMHTSTLSKGPWIMAAVFFLLMAAADAHDLLQDLTLLTAGISAFTEFLGWCAYLPLALLIFFPVDKNDQRDWTWVPFLDFLLVGMAAALAYFRFIYLPHSLAGEPWTVVGRAELTRNFAISAGLLLRSAIDPSPQSRGVFRRVGGVFAGVSLLRWMFPGYLNLVVVIGRPALWLFLGILAVRWTGAPDLGEEQNQRRGGLRLFLSLSAAATLLLVVVLALTAPSNYRVLMFAVVGISVVLFILRSALAEHSRYTSEAQQRASEHDFRVLFDSAIVPIVIFEPEGERIVQANAAACEMYGVEPGGLAGASLKDFTKNVARGEGQIVELLRTGTCQRFESVHLTRDGREIDVLVSSSIVQYQGQKAILSFNRDITEQKSAERALRASGEKFRELTDSIPDIYFAIDSDHRVIYWNKLAEALTGVAASEILGRHGSELFPEFLGSEPDRVIDEALLTGIPRTLVHPYRLRGQDFVFESTVNPTRAGATILARDITARRQAEESLRASEDRYRDLVEHSHDLICTHDLKGNLLSLNKEPARILGYSPFELLKISMRDLLAPEFRDQFDCYLEKIKREGSARGLLAVRTRSGETRLWEYDNTLRTEGVPEPIVRGMAHDVTERKRAEQAAAAVAKEFDNFFDVAVDLLCIADTDGHFRRLNKMWETTLGYTQEELISKPFLDFIHPDDVESTRCAVRDLTSQKRIVNFVNRYRCRDGSYRWFEWDAVPAGKMIYAAARDITERKWTEEALRRGTEQNRLLADLLEKAGQPFAVGYPDGRIGPMNIAFERLTGYTRDELRNIDWNIALTPPEWREAEQAYLEKLQTTGHPVRYQKEYLRKDGSRVPIELLVHLRRDEHGKPAFYYAFLTDLTERRQAEEALRESEERFRTLVENATVGIYRTTPEGAILMANSALVEMLGYDSFEELTARDLEPEGFGPDYPRQDFKSLLERDEEVRGLESTWTRKDSTSLFVRESARAIRDHDGKVVYYDGIVEDITERKRAEEARRYLASMVESSEDAIFGKTCDGVIQSWNRGAEKLYGYTAEEMIGQPVFVLVPGDRRSEVEDFLLRIRRGEGIEHHITQRVRKDGVQIDVSLSLSPIKDAHGQVVGASAIARDITDIKRAEERVEASEEKFRKAFMTGADAFYIATLEDGRILEVNDCFENVFGYSRAEATGRTMLELGIYTDHEDRRKMVSEVQAKGYVRNLEMTARRKNGEFINMLISANRLRGSGKEMLLGVVRDITERKRAEQALVRLRQAVDASGEVVFMTDREGTITSINPEFTRLYGYTKEDVVGKSTPRILKSDVQAPEKYSRFWNTILQKKIARGEIVNRTKEGTLVTVETSVNPVLDERGEMTGFLAIQRDITARKQLEEQFRQSQKMEAIGRLAGGVAHDFNNLLTVINGYAQLLLEDVSSTDPRHAQLSEIVKAGERAASLTRQLLAFSRKQVLEPRVLSLNSVIDGMHKMIQRLIGEDVELRCVGGEPLGLVRADAAQLEQVILNLTVNARDAMPHGGVLSIETSDQELGADYAVTHNDVKAGRYVMIAVSDTGVGMDAPTIAHIFEPFFTTKGQGKGTGLGLSTVYGIVKQTGGHISVYSEPGRGTTFKIYLPEVEPSRAVGTQAEGHSRPPGGSETILLVEDEDAVRRLASQVLNEYGYNVLESTSPEDAVHVSQSYERTIDLLLTDVVMPGMSGRNVAEHLAFSRPDMKVLYMSGYTDDAIVHHGVLDSGMAFLQKPFTPEKLALRVREVLDTRVRNSGRN